MKKALSFACIATLMLVPLHVQSANKKNSDKPKQEVSVNQEEGAVSVNDHMIPANELRLLQADQQAAGAKASPELSNAVREQLIARELLAAEGRKLGLDKYPEIITRVRMTREELLSRAYQMQYLAQHAPAEAQIKAAYESIKQRAGNKEYHVRQIFVKSEDEAKSVINKLDSGEDFAKLASSVSKDQASREKGGDLGWLSALVLQTPVVTVISTLKNGEFTKTPIKAPDGWHVIQLDDTRPYTLPTIEQLKPQIQRDLAKMTLEAHLGELRKNATIK